MEKPYIHWCAKHHEKLIIGKKGRLVCLSCKKEKKEQEKEDSE